MRLMVLAATALAAAVAAASPLQAASVAARAVTLAVHHDLSLPLRYLVTMAPPIRPPRKHIEAREAIPLPWAAGPERPDEVLQTAAKGMVGTIDGLNFAGAGEGDYGYSVVYTPSDVNGAVGATQYVQQVNSSFAIFDKTSGALVLPIANSETLWAGFGGGCETNNNGDGIVKYDRIANRWVISQFVSTTPYLECVAVSQTSDATGAYYRYAFSYGDVDFDDYPKLGVWPDAYYVTYNIFADDKTFIGAMLCALDRTSMLSGEAATQQCFQLSSAYGAVLPADLDGAALPPAGSPNYLVAFGLNELNLWRFHVDWATPANTTLTGPVAIPVAAFTPACARDPRFCVPEKGTTELVDSLGDRLMYRLAYRNFGDHESLVVNHSIKSRIGVGVRWYELRDTGGAPTVFQSGTFAPGGGFRWNGSIAMDKVGDIALGYSELAPTAFPSIRYTGRVPGDVLGRLEGEKIVKAGGGSQVTPNARWGDYSGMSVDPVDDCTFFYTNEYFKVSDQFNWNTQIASFKFPACS